MVFEMRTIVGVLLGAIFVSAMVYALMRESQIRCEVCLDYRGDSACRTALALDRDSAVQGAVTSACAVLSRGVTDGIRCGATPPRSVSCGE